MCLFVILVSRPFITNDGMYLSFHTKCKTINSWSAENLPHRWLTAWPWTSPGSTWTQSGDDDCRWSWSHTRIARCWSVKGSSMWAPDTCHEHTHSYNTLTWFCLRCVKSPTDVRRAPYITYRSCLIVIDSLWKQIRLTNKLTSCFVCATSNATFFDLNSYK